MQDIFELNCSYQNNLQLNNTLEYQRFPINVTLVLAREMLW